MKVCGHYSGSVTHNSYVSGRVLKKNFNFGGHFGFLSHVIEMSESSLVNNFFGFSIFKLCKNVYLLTFPQKCLELYISLKLGLVYRGPCQIPLSAILLPPSHKSKKMLPRKRDISQSHTEGSFSGPALTIMSSNVEGLSAAKQQLVADLSSKHRCAVVCMQETHRGPNDIRPNVPGMD